MERPYQAMLQPESDVEDEHEYYSLIYPTLTLTNDRQRDGLSPTAPASSIVSGESSTPPPSYGSLNNARDRNVRRSDVTTACKVPNQQVERTRQGRPCGIFCGGVIAAAVILSVATFAYCVPTLVEMRNDYYGKFNQSISIYGRVQVLSEQVEKLQEINVQLQAAIHENREGIERNDQNIQRNENDIEEIKRQIGGGTSRIQTNTILMVVCIALVVAVW